MQVYYVNLVGIDLLKMLQKLIHPIILLKSVKNVHQMFLCETSTPFRILNISCAYSFVHSIVNRYHIYAFCRAFGLG